MSTSIIAEEIPLKKSEKIWKRDFFLLWQGQLVSAIGDAMYEIALGFWILITTGSTGLMGALMAASMIPRILLSPLAGAWVDRINRKWLLVLMDGVRGVAVVLVGIAAIAGFLKVWMAFTAGMIIGAGGAFFNPSIGSILPDLVKKEQLVKANSFFSMIRAGSGILGNSTGGILLAAIGAPILFLLNGISFLFSAVTELFIQVPKIRHDEKDWSFWADIRQGFQFSWKNSGLRFFIGAAAAVNFIAMIGFVLILPLFQSSAALGPAKYGLLLASLTVGMLLGTILTAGIKISQKTMGFMLTAGLLGCSIMWGIFPLFNSFAPMAACILVGGLLNGTVNILLQSIIQMSTPRNMRGKIMGLLEALTGGLTPLGMAVGGLLGEFLPIRAVISVSFFTVGLLCIPLAASKGLKSFVRLAVDDDA